MARIYRSWRRDYSTKRFNSTIPSRSNNYSLRKFLTRLQLIRLWNGRSKGRFNY